MAHLLQIVNLQIKFYHDEKKYNIHDFKLHDNTVKKKNRES